MDTTKCIAVVKTINLVRGLALYEFGSVELSLAPYRFGSTQFNKQGELEFSNLKIV